MKKKFSIKQPLRQWLALLLVMLVSTTAAQAYEYVTLNGSSSYTSDYLQSTCSGKHVKISAGATTLNVSSNLSIKEIYAPDNDLTIVLSNHAKFYIEQETSVTMSAMNVKSLTIRGEGYIYITGNDNTLGLHGGKLEVSYSTAKFTSRSGNAIVAKEGSEVLINNSTVTISAPAGAVTGWPNTSNKNLDYFEVAGSQSHVTVNGFIGDEHNRITQFNVTGGYFSLSKLTNDGADGVRAETANLTGGQIYINHKGYNATTVVAGLYCNSLNAQNCELDVNTTASAAIYAAGSMSFNHCKVRAIANNNGNGLWARNIIDIKGNQMSQRLLATGRNGIVSPGTINISCRNLIARGYSQNGIHGHIINLNPQSGFSWEVYSEGGVNPLEATSWSVYGSNTPKINLVRPVGAQGSVPGHEGTYPGVLINNGTSFGTNSTTPFIGYVKLYRPYITNITGANNPFLLREGGVNTKIVLPGDTMKVNMTPLNPYRNYENCVMTLRLYRRPYNDESGDLIHEEVINGDTWSYTFTQQDVDAFITAEVSLDGYEGTLATKQYYVHKLENWDYPVKPTLTYVTGNVRVTNARSNQEYILLTPAQFTQFLYNPENDSWWANSIKPTSNGTISMSGGTLGVVNYVATRFKETTTHLPGERYEDESILLDNVTVTKGLSLTVTPQSSGNFAEMEYLNGYVTYTTKKNGVLKLVINPLPGNATDFAGIRGQDFYITYNATAGSNVCQLYANAACTTPLSDNTRYKTVYLKPILSGCNQLALGMELVPDNGGPDDVVASTQLYLNVSEDNGSFLPYKLVVNNGDTLVNYNNKVEGIPFTVFPARATLPGNVTVTYYTVQGPFPSVASQTSRLPSFTVDKENRTITLIPNTSDMLTNHTYSFTVSHKVNNVSYGYGYLKVKVVERPIYSLSISPAEAEVPLGGKLQLNITSDLPNAWREYGNKTITSSNPDVATVAYVTTTGIETYVVTMTNDPEMIGESATITLSAGGKQASCVVTVSGEKYPLWIAGTQVNSENKDDVLGNGKVKFEGGATGGMLTLDGATITSSSATTAALRSEIENLTINTVGTNKLSASKEVVSLVESAQIGGTGELTVTSTGSSGLIVALAGYKDITINGSVKVKASNNSSNGIGVISLGSMSVNSPDAQLRGFGKFASLGYSELLAGTITEPQGGQPVYYSSLDNYFVGDANGNIVSNAWVTINGTATFMPGDVNGDGSVTSADVTALYNYLLNNDSSSIVNGDQNGDGEITSADVTAVYNVLLGS